MTQEMADEEVVKLVLGGQVEDFEKLVNKYSAKLIGYVMTLVNGHRQSAEDIVQETFIKAYVNLRQFKLDRKFSSWIYRIAHNEAINYIKKHKKELVPEDETWADNIADGRASTEDKIDTNFNDAKVKKAVFALNLKYREPIVLYIYYGKSYSEIAKILKIPTSTAGVRISRAKALLKKSLAQEEINYE